MAFRGTYELTIDAKNRLTVPSKLRSSFPGTIVSALGLDDTPALWRPEDYDAYTAQALAGLHPLSEPYRELNRLLSHRAWETELDSAGRVRLDTGLLEGGRLGREVVVAGADQCLEIWDRDRWHQWSRDTVAKIPDLTARLGHTA